MEKTDFEKIEKFMILCCGDSAHDREHTYRVLYNALDIAKYTDNVNTDILIAACLLHDIARSDESVNKEIDHAVYGSEKAHKWLVENGFDNEFSDKVSECIRCHRYRGANIPDSIEAKILFDADKIDAAGFMGIARTLMYGGFYSRPLYTYNGETVSDGSDNRNSFFGEYVFKLRNVYDRLFTERAKEIAFKMKKDAEYFYKTLYNEVAASSENGRQALKNMGLL